MRFHALLKHDFDTDSTEIGFNLFHSPDSKKLTSFIEKLKLEQQENVCPT